MTKILIIFGTRPEAIKMAPLVKEFKKDNKFDTKICVTAQHREMLDQVLEIFDLKPDYDLNIMKQNQDLYDITSNILLQIKKVFDDFKPDYVFVHGDTTTTFASSLAAFYKQIKICHVEAGLRTYDIYNPFPEEANRVLTSKLTKFHFAPTNKAMQNLLKENVDKNSILVTGNTVIDALFWVLDKIKSDLNLEKEIYEKIKHFLDDKIDIKKDKFILVTAHRRENFGNGIENICHAIKTLAQNNQNIKFIYPVHLNPNIQEPVFKILSKISNIYLIKPLDYLEFSYLMSLSYLVLTDSGGVQEEAPSLGKPVLVLRNTTERPEAVDAGTVKLVGTCIKEIVKTTQLLIDDKNEYGKMSKASNPYGDGKACEKIVGFLKEATKDNV